MLNAQHYTPEQVLALVGVDERFRDLSRDPLIVCDITLIIALTVRICT